MAPSKQQKAGLSKIDHVLITHFHGDHVDGLRALSKMIPIDKIYDHGDRRRGRSRPAQRLQGYCEAQPRDRKPGDEIALKGGVKITVVASEARFIDKPVNGGGSASSIPATSQRLHFDIALDGTADMSQRPPSHRSAADILQSGLCEPRSPLKISYEICLDRYFLEL